MISGDLNFASDWLVALGNLPFVCVTYFLNFVHLLTNTHTQTHKELTHWLCCIIWRLWHTLDVVQLEEEGDGCWDLLVTGVITPFFASHYLFWDVSPLLKPANFYGTISSSDANPHIFVLHKVSSLSQQCWPLAGYSNVEDMISLLALSVFTYPLAFANCFTIEETEGSFDVGLIEISGQRIEKWAECRIFLQWILHCAASWCYGSLTSPWAWFHTCLQFLWCFGSHSGKKKTGSHAGMWREKQWEQCTARSAQVHHAGQLEMSISPPLLLLLGPGGSNTQNQT